MIVVMSLDIFELLLLVVVGLWYRCLDSIFFELGVVFLILVIMVILILVVEIGLFELNILFYNLWRFLFKVELLSGYGVFFFRGLFKENEIWNFKDEVG